MDEILDDAQAIKAKELVQEYVRGEREAVTLVNELLTDAGTSMDSFMTKVLRDRIDEIERIDRLTAIAETRRNAAGVAWSSVKRCDAACKRSRTTMS